MAASKCNYIVVYKTSSQVYSSTSLKTAAMSPPPKGHDLKDRTILFMSYLLDEKNICVYPLTDEQINEVMESNEQQDSQSDSQTSGE